MAAVALGGANEIGLVLLTHGHRDHVDGAPSLAVHAVAPVRAAIAGLCSPGQRPLVNAEQVVVGNLRLEVVSTPGHTADSICFVLDADHALLTGDTMLGQGSTVVARPDGRLGRLPRDFASTTCTRRRTPAARRPAWAWSCR